MVARKSYKSRRKFPARKKMPKKSGRMNKNLVALIKKVTLRSQETKKSVALNPVTNKTTLLENGEITYLDYTPLATTQGVTDPNGSRIANRVGDEVTPVGLSIKFMVGMHYQQSQVRFKWLLIRHQAGDLPTDDTLFTFADMAVNRQLCTVDTERFTIVAQKNFTINALNKGVTTATNTGTTVVEGGTLNTGLVYANPAVDAIGMSSKLVNIWIPGRKFGKVLRYQNASSSPKNFSYCSLIIPYNNMYGSVQTLLAGGIKVARMDDYISQFYFKDA